MKRWRRWVFNFAAGVSLVLCIMAAVLWGRSYWRTDSVRLYYGQHRTGVFGLALESGAGGLGTGFSHSMSKTNPAELSWFSYWSFPRTGSTGGYPEAGGQGKALAPGSWLNRRGFQYQRFLLGDPPDWNWYDRQHILTVPYWVYVLLTGILPAVALLRVFRRHHRRLHGLCPACGYDLRATPDRCPECGAVPATEKGAAT